MSSEEPSSHETPVTGAQGSGSAAVFLRKPLVPWPRNTSTPVRTDRRLWKRWRSHHRAVPGSMATRWCCPPAPAAPGRLGSGSLPRDPGPEANESHGQSLSGQQGRLCRCPGHAPRRREQGLQRGLGWLGPGGRGQLGSSMGLTPSDNGQHLLTASFLPGLPGRDPSSPPRTPAGGHPISPLLAGGPEAQRGRPASRPRCSLPSQRSLAAPRGTGFLL